MRKVLVEVFVPAAGQTHDIFLPGHLVLGEAVKLVSKAAADISEGLFEGSENTVMCLRGDGVILNMNLTVDELKLQNGSRLMLV